MAENKMIALHDFVLGKDRIKAGEAVDCDPDCMARLKQKGFVGEGSPRNSKPTKKKTPKSK
jgi:hypothetical protein